MKSRRKWQAIIEDLDKPEAKKINEIIGNYSYMWIHGEMSYGEYVKKMADALELYEADGVEIFTKDGAVSGFVDTVLTEIKIVAIIGKAPEISIVDIAKKNKEIFVYTGE